MDRYEGSDEAGDEQSPTEPSSGDASAWSHSDQSPTGEEPVASSTGDGTAAAEYAAWSSDASYQQGQATPETGAYSTTEQPMANLPPIYLTQDDMDRLLKLVESQPGKSFAKLENELLRASIVPRDFCAGESPPECGPLSDAGAASASRLPWASSSHVSSRLRLRKAKRRTPAA